MESDQKESENIKYTVVWHGKTIYGSHTALTPAVCFCVEALRPSQPNGIMSSAVSLFKPHVYWAGLVLQAVNQYCSHCFARTDNCPS